KEHEYILAVDGDAKDIHKALLVARAMAGAPCTFGPGNKFVPATRSLIKVGLQYEKNKQLIAVPAQHWIPDPKTRKDREYDWIFGGSRFVPDRDDKEKPPHYEANEGDLICMCNMTTAMMDLPVKSAKALDSRLFEAHAERIPKIGTKVDVILEV